jgi:hypothetical protein
MEDVTKSLQASASLLFRWKKGGAGLGRKDAAPVYIHVLWGMKIQNNK